MGNNTSFRVLWLTEHYPPQRGGMSQSCDRIVQALRTAGVWIDVAHFSARYTAWQVERKLHGRLLTCPLDDDPAHALNLCWNLLRRTAQTAYSHVIAFGGVVPMLAGPVFATWLRAPLVTLLRGNDFDIGVFSPRLSSIVREALQHAACVCAVSKDKLEKVTALYPHTPVAWTPNGIDLSNWQFTLEDKHKAQQWRTANVTCGGRVLGVFGQLKRKKGGVFFLEALTRSGVADKFHVLLVGDMEAEMHEWLATAGTSLACTVVPFLDRYTLLPYYAACDLIALPSFYDGMPNVLLESLGLAIPVVAAAVGGMADILIDHENALLFAPGDPLDCREALLRAVRLEATALHRLGENGQRYVASQLTQQAEAERYLNVLQETSTTSHQQ